MGLDALKAALPGYARDTRLNLGIIETAVGSGALTPEQGWGTALACAFAARNGTVLREVTEEAAGRVKPEAIEAAKAAASIMAMNNVYYRAKHLIGHDAYQKLPARLRMQVIGAASSGSLGVDRADFELWCLAVSAITGCETCLRSHEQVVIAAEVGRERVHEALRIAAVVHAVAVTLDAEAALRAESA